MKLFSFLLCSFGAHAVTCSVTCFQVKKSACKSSWSACSTLSMKEDHASEPQEVHRRQFLEGSGLLVTSGAFMTTTLFDNIAQASGGATAGGAYLLSAKQRYNTRVVAGLQAFSGLGASLDQGSIDAAKKYFSGDEEGSWQDCSTAGYLLANAFRTNSTTPPDKLPAVKAWKAFVKEVEAMMKAVKKKDSKGAAASYANAMGALDAYLSQVQLQI